MKSKYKKRLEKLREDFESGLILSGIDVSDVDYNILVVIRNKFDSDLLEILHDKEKEIVDRVENLIVEEMNIANKEGQPTSRLTSLAVKLKGKNGK